MQSARGGKPRGAGRRKTLPAPVGSASQSAEYQPIDTDPIQPPASLPRKRSKTTEFFDGANDEPEDTNQKGGHSLRRRTRIDYTFEEANEEATPTRVKSQVGPASASTRGRKRRADHDDEVDFGPPARRRATAYEVLHYDGSPRRKNPSRRTAETKSYTEFADENDVKDTIEVGGRLNESDYHESSSLLQPSDDGNGEPPHSPVQDALPEHFVIKFPLPSEALIREAEALTSHITKSPEPIDIDPRLHADAGLSEEHAAMPPQVFEEKEPVSHAVNETDQDQVPPAESTTTGAELPSSVAATSDIQAPSEEQVSRPRGRSMAPRIELEQHTGSQILDDSSATTLAAIDAGRSKSAPPMTALTGSSMATATPTVVDAPVTEVTENHLESEKTQSETQPEIQPEVLQPAESTNIDSDQSTTDTTVAITVTPPTDTDDAATNIAPKDAIVPKEPSPSDAVTTEAKTVGESTVVPMVKEIKPESHPTVIEPPQVPAAPVKPWSHLTPHLEGQWVKHPESRLPQIGEAEVSNGSGKTFSTPTTKPLDGDTTIQADDDAELPVDADQEDPDEPVESGAASPGLEPSTLNSPVPDLNHATAASSPAANEDDDPDDAATQTPDELQTQKFYEYPRLRDTDEFKEVLQNYKDMSDEDLYAMCAHIDGALVALQEEYLQLGAIVDDHENIERRKAHDEAYEQMEKRSAKVTRKTFVLKGYRAKMTQEEKETAYQRHQDRIQAAAYGFRYDSHQAKVGKQDPIAQRYPGDMEDGGEPRRTLRSDPLRSAKATEAADESGPHMSGKRIRKPRELFDPATAATSRSATPVPQRRKRGSRLVESYTEDHDTLASAAQDPTLINGVSANTTPHTDGRTKRGRGKRAASPTESFLATSSSAAGDGVNHAPLHDETMQPPPAKRIRRATNKAQQAAANEAAGSRHPAVSTTNSHHHSGIYLKEEDDHEVENSPPRKNQRIVTLKPGAKNIRALSNAPSAASTTEDSRPGTSSSVSSEGSADSSYSFRPKRQRKFRDTGDEYAEDQQPKTKRARRATKKAEESSANHTLQLPSLHDGVVSGSSQHAEPHQAQEQRPRIKFLNSGVGPSINGAPSGPTPTISLTHHATDATSGRKKATGPKKTPSKAPAKGARAQQPVDASPSADGQGPLGGMSAQQYAALSKSEKMSRSMKSKSFPLLKGGKTLFLLYSSCISFNHSHTDFLLPQ